MLVILTLKTTIKGVIMSDLQPKPVEINLAGEKYDLLFSINVIDAIQDKFDAPISDLQELMKNYKTQFKTIRFVLTALINEGTKYRNETLDEKRKLVTEDYVGLRINTNNLIDIAGSINKAFSDGVPKGEDEEIPNALTE